MNLKSKKVLVTGAGGFIGSNLVEELVKSGVRVKALVHYNSSNDWGNIEALPKPIRDELEIFAGDIRDAFAMQQCVKGCSVVFHLAALIGIPYSYVAPEAYVDTNIKGTLNMLQAALANNVEKFVQTSTSETYGTAIYTPIDEKHPLQGQSPYSASKIGADKIAESYHLSFGLPVATIRPFNTYGIRQSARAVIPTIIAQALTKDKIKLGSLTPVRDLTFVKDTVRGFIKIAEADSSVGEVINIGSGFGITIKELVDKILAIVGQQVEVVCDEARVRPEKSEVRQLIADNRKAGKLVGWQPGLSLEAGLGQTVEWLRENIKSYKADLYNV
ncbi:MAG: SDR family NAD(P)-dependent oxidoreductase [Candidatus Margulisbacteria bacterium]|nr:SDR family NAD(P)-dependent oxidoreductase [Candidatus Margulisiibacteriota bacterium]